VQPLAVCATVVAPKPLAQLVKAVPCPENNNNNNDKCTLVMQNMLFKIFI
jgi:hypothetical protein